MPKPEIRLFRAALLASAVPIALLARPARAAAPDAASHAVEEVVVTAQKRPERLRTLTVTATVLSSKAITQQNITDVSQLNNVLPAVNINGTFNGRVPLGVRGISSDANESAVGIASGVGIEIDGIPIPSDSFAGNSIEDLADVELLEGPQATLGGRTASSGIINYVTHSPTPKLSGSFATTITNDGEQHAVGTIAGPITQGVDFSLTGWGHHVTEPIVNLNGNNNSTVSDEGFRAKIHAKLADNIDATLFGSLAKTQSAGANFAYSYLYPGAYILAGPAGGPPFWSQQALFPPGVKIGPGNGNYASPVNDAHENRTDGDIGLILSADLGGGYNLTSTTDYQHEIRQDVQDLFDVNGFFGNEAQQFLGIPFAFPNSQELNINVSQETEEVRLASPATDRLNYVAGIFYSNTEVEQHQLRTFTPAYDNSQRNAGTQTIDGYFHANWKVLRHTTITGGVRFNYDMLNYLITEGQNPYAPAFTPLAAYRSQASSNSTALVGDIGVRQDLTRDVQVYATYTRGYAPQAYNTAFIISSNAPLTPVGQEHIDSFELGTKGRYFGGTLQVDASLFYTLYHNYQIQTFTNIPGQPFGFLNLNSAGEAVTRGAEANVVWRPLDNTLVTLNGTWLNAEYLQYQGGPCWWGGSVSLLPKSCYVANNGSLEANLSNTGMANAPRVKVNASLYQTIPLSERYDLVLGGLVSYTSRTEFQPDQNPYAYQTAHAIVNLQATIQRDAGQYALTFFVDNVGNTHYYSDIEDFWNTVWGSNAVVGQPARDFNRYFGFTLTGRF